MMALARTWLAKLAAVAQPAMRQRAHPTNRPGPRRYAASVFRLRAHLARRSASRGRSGHEDAVSILAAAHLVSGETRPRPLRPPVTTSLAAVIASGRCCISPGLPMFAYEERRLLDYGCGGGAVPVWIAG